MLGILDTELVKNANWVIYDDAAGTNKKVYSCTVTGWGEWFLVVDDNYSAYYITSVNDGWDADAHTLTGQTTTSVYHSKDGARYKIILNDSRVIIIDHGGTNNWSRISYHGMTVPHPGCDKILLTVGGSSTTYDSATHMQDPAGHVWKCLYDPYDAVNVAVYILGRIAGADSDWRLKRDKDGFFHLRPTSMYAYGGTDKLNIGFLDGLILTGVHNDVLANYEIVVANGVEWEAHFDGNYGAFVRLT